VKTCGDDSGGKGTHQVRDPGPGARICTGRARSVDCAIVHKRADRAREQRAPGDTRTAEPTDNNYGDGLSIAFELVATPAIFGLIGFGLDRWLGTTPLFTLVFSMSRSSPSSGSPSGATATRWTAPRASAAPRAPKPGPAPPAGSNPAPSAPRRRGRWHRGARVSTLRALRHRSSQRPTSPSTWSSAAVWVAPAARPGVGLVLGVDGALSAGVGVGIVIANFRSRRPCSPGPHGSRWVRARRGDVRLRVPAGPHHRRGAAHQGLRLGRARPARPHPHHHPPRAAALGDQVRLGLAGLPGLKPSASDLETSKE
jgi:hypothetical protein